MTLQIQALTMLHMVGAGVYLGAAFDTFQTFRVKKHRWVIVVQDLLFWIVNGLLIFIWLKAVNDGQMRTYIFLSLCCGYAAYQAILQQAYITFLKRIVRLISYMYRLTVSILTLLIIKPIQWLYSLSVSIVVLLLSALVKMGEILISFLMWLVRPIQLFVVRSYNKYWKEISHQKGKKEPVEGTKKRGILYGVAKWFLKKQR